MNPNTSRRACFRPKHGLSHMNPTAGDLRSRSRHRHRHRRGSGSSVSSDGLAAGTAGVGAAVSVGAAVPVGAAVKVYRSCIHRMSSIRAEKGAAGGAGRTGLRHRRHRRGGARHQCGDQGAARHLQKWAAQRRTEDGGTVTVSQYSVWLLYPQTQTNTCTQSSTARGLRRRAQRRERR